MNQFEALEIMLALQLLEEQRKREQEQEHKEYEE